MVNSRLLLQGRRYLSIMAWMVQDILAHHRVLTASSVLFFGVSLAFQASALGILSKYIHLLETSRQFSFLGMFFPSPRSSLMLLWITTLACVSALLLGYAAHFTGSFLALRLWTKYESLCSRRAIELIALYGGHQTLDSWQTQFKKVIGYDARCCGLVARLSILMFQPAATWVVTLGVLLHLEFALTMILVALVAISAPILYMVSVRGAKHSMAAERQGPASVKQKREELIRLAASASGGDPSPEDDIGRRSKLDKVEAYLASQAGRRIAVEESRLVTNVIMGSALALILLQQGELIIQTGTGWTQLAAYLVLLRVNLASFTQGARLIASINRFYPQCQRYMIVVKALIVVSAGGATCPLPIPAATAQSNFDADEDMDDVA